MPPLFYFIAFVLFLYIYVKYIIAPLDYKTLDLADKSQEPSWRVQLGFLLIPVVPVVFVFCIAYVVSSFSRLIGFSESTSVLIACFALLALAIVGSWSILSSGRRRMRG